MDINVNELLFKIYTPYGYYHEYRYDKALKYYKDNNGFLLLGYTTDLFPKWYKLKERKRPHGNKWFIMETEVLNDALHKLN